MRSSYNSKKSGTFSWWRILATGANFKFLTVICLEHDIYWILTESLASCLYDVYVIGKKLQYTYSYHYQVLECIHLSVCLSVFMINPKVKINRFISMICVDIRGGGFEILSR